MIPRSWLWSLDLEFSVGALPTLSHRCPIIICIVSCSGSKSSHVNIIPSVSWARFSDVRKGDRHGPRAAIPRCTVGLCRQHCRSPGKAHYWQSHVKVRGARSSETCSCQSLFVTLLEDWSTSVGTLLQKYQSKTITIYKWQQIYKRPWLKIWSEFTVM